MLRRLISGGASTMECRTDMPSVTLPCHQTMLRGVGVGRHGVNTNVFHPLVRPVPSLIDAARQRGLRTGSFYNWEQLRDLSDPGSLDVSHYCHAVDTAEGDQRVAETAVEHLERLDPGFAFVYFGHLDHVGHRDGWMSANYLDAIANADLCIGRLVEAQEGAGRLASTVVLVTSDHGGHERVHGTEMDEDMLVPWVLWGAGIRRGHAIEEQVELRDTCTTLAHILGVAPAPEWEGRVITQALAEPE